MDKFGDLANMPDFGSLDKDGAEDSDDSDDDGIIFN